MAMAKVEAELPSLKEHLKGEASATARGDTILGEIGRRPYLRRGRRKNLLLECHHLIRVFRLICTLVLEIMQTNSAVHYIISPVCPAPLTGKGPLVLITRRRRRLWTSFHSSFSTYIYIIQFEKHPRMSHPVVLIKKAQSTPSKTRSLSALSCLPQPTLHHN